MTAKSFVDMFNRNANPKLQSPSQPFMDVIVGASAVIDGKASTISGVKAVGNKLTIALTQPGAGPALAPGDDVLLGHQPAARGEPRPERRDTRRRLRPVLHRRRTPNKSITLKRNPYYKGPRPHNVNEIDFKIGNTLDVIQQNVESGTTDFAAGGSQPPTWAPLAAKYGVNKGRVCTSSRTLAVDYLAMNNDRPLFKGNRALAAGRQLGHRPSRC